MRQFLLAAILIAVPVAIFTTALHLQAAAPAAGLGDMGKFVAIVSDVQAIAAKRDIPGAATRITDLESAWDDAEPGLRPLNPEQWGRVDGGVDKALKSLRAASPDPATVTVALANLQTILADPAKTTGGTVYATNVEGIAITDTAGQFLPCETMINAARDKLATAKPDAATTATVGDLQAKATERCNADDDQHADIFSAQALAILGQ